MATHVMQSECGLHQTHAALQTTTMHNTHSNRVDGEPSKLVLHLRLIELATEESLEIEERLPSV